MSYKNTEIGVKIIETKENLEKLEKEIEGRLNVELKNKEIIDIKYSAYYDKYNKEYSALIIYKK